MMRACRLDMTDDDKVNACTKRVVKSEGNPVLLCFTLWSVSLMNENHLID